MTRLELPIEDNSGSTGNGIPYIESWAKIRRKFNVLEFECDFPDFNVIAIALRVGGKLGYFGGTNGIERRRISRRSGYLSCDNVVQYNLLCSEYELHSPEKALNDFHPCNGVCFGSRRCNGEYGVPGENFELH